MYIDNDTVKRTKDKCNKHIASYLALPAYNFAFQQRSVWTNTKSSEEVQEMWLCILLWKRVSGIIKNESSGAYCSQC